MAKLNCWEFKKCGRQPNGNKSMELGICPTSIKEKYDGTNFGKNSGRCCWKVAGTLCDGTVQGTYAHKMISCEECDFYLAVKKEEGIDFIF